MTFEDFNEHNCGKSVTEYVRENDLSVRALLDDNGSLFVTDAFKTCIFCLDDEDPKCPAKLMKFSELEETARESGCQGIAYYRDPESRIGL